MNDTAAPQPAVPADADHQTADVAISAGSFSLQAKVRLTPGGLLAIAVLVSGILLSTAVLVRAAKR